MTPFYKFLCSVAVIFLIIFVQPDSTFSQFENDFIVESWKVENGLPQHTINALAQTSDGFIWIGTEGGLARFDGFNFKVFDKSSSPVLSTNRITALAADDKNRLFMGNRDGGIGYYENGRFNVIDLGSKSDDMSVSSVVVESDNEVYFTSKSFGLILYQAGKIIKFPLSDDEKRSIRNLVKTEDGLFLIFDKKIEKINSTERKLFYSGKPTDVILNLYHIKDRDEYIILTKDVLLSKIEDREFIIEKYDRDELTFARNPLSPFLNHYLLFMIRGEVNLLDTRSNKVIRDHGLFDSYSDLWIGQTFQDKDGNLWLGSESGGLMRIRTNPFQRYPRAQKTGRSSNSVAWYNNNSLALYQSTSGLQYLSYMSSITRKVYPDGSNDLLPQFNIRTNTIYSFLEDQSKKLYLGSLGKGIYRLNGMTPELLPFPDDITRWVFALYQDRSGNILAGTRGGGLFELAGDSLKMVRNAPDRLKNANITYITEIGDTLWVSSDESIFSRVGDAWTDWSTKITISRDFFRGIASVDENFIVVGSYGNGMLLLNPKTSEAKRLNVTNGLRDNVASYLHVDTNGNLWSTGNLGLTLISDDELKQFLYQNKERVLSTTYNKIHGAPSDEYQGGYLNSGLVLSDGNLLLPGLNGFLKADIKTLTSSKVPDKVYLDKISYGVKELNNVDSLRVEYADTKLEIRYTAPYFSSNIKPIYLYKLEGYNTEWVEGNELQIASYTNVPPGNYVFKIRVGLRDGKWSTNETSLYVSIKPPFYLANWFRFVVLLFVIYLIYLIIKFSNQKWIAVEKKRFQMILDAQEQERNRIAADLHDGVGQLLSAIKLRLDFAKKNYSNDNEEMKEVITESRSLLDNIADEIRSISFNLIPSSLKKFGLVQAMDETIQKTSFGNDLVIKFIPITTKERYDENVELTLFRIFQELLYNATKHAQAREIDIQLIEHQHEIILMFEDDGTGFDYQKSLRESSGRGISNITSRVHILGGSVNFDSDTKNGTTVTVTIPNR